MSGCDRGAGLQERPLEDVIAEVFTNDQRDGEREPAEAATDSFVG